MKKVLSLVLALVMVLGSFSMVSAAPYSDVAGTTVESAVDRLSLLGILEGYPDGSFKPEGSITRAEFAAVAVRAKGLEAVAQASNGLPTGFKDVAATSWMSGYVGTAGKLGIVNGVGNGMFAPAAPVKYEEAVTMIVRALGYEAAAQAKGGYPYGYLIVANEVGLLDAVKGTQGVPATRALVAQLTDNALEVPMMVQVGFGTEIKWVVSGTEGTKLRTLLDETGFENVEGRVTSFDSAKNRITLNVEGKSKTLKVNDGFDFNFVDGLTIKAWFSNDTVVVYTAIDEAILAATEGAAKIKVDGKAYVVAKDAYLELDGDNEVEATEFDADYAKVVLNDDNEIVWAKGYAWDDTFVAYEVKDEVIYSYDKDNLIVKNYTIVKDGKTLELDDVEEGDLLFFNKGEKFAVVYNETKTGEIERVYDASFKFDGKSYDYDAGNYDVKFVDEDVVGVVDKDILAAMKDEGKVEVFFDFAGNAVLVIGERGEVKTNSFYGVVSATTAPYQLRGTTWYWSFDVLNEEGKVVKYDLTKTFVEDAEKYVATAAWGPATIKKDTVVRVTLNDKGDIVKVENLGAGVAFDSEVKVKDAEYVKGYKLHADTVVVLANAAAVKDYEVMKWSEADKSFTSILANAENLVFAGDKGRVGVLFVKHTNVQSTNHVGLVTDVRKVRSTSDIWDVTIEIKGVEKVYSTDGELDLTSVVLEDKIVKITLTDKDKITAAAPVVAPLVQSGLVTKVNTSGTLTVGSSVYELVDGAVVYDATNNFKAINLRDLNENDTVSVYRLDTATTRFINYVVRTVKAPTTPGATRGDATVRTAFTTDNTANQNIYLTVNGNLKVYNLLKTALIEDASNVAIANGTVIAANKVVNFVLVEGTTDIAYIKVLN